VAVGVGNSSAQLPENGAVSPGSGQPSTEEDSLSNCSSSTLITPSASESSVSGSLLTASALEITRKEASKRSSVSSMTSLPSETLLSIPSLVELNNNSMRFQVEMSMALAHECDIWSAASTSHSAVSDSCEAYASCVEQHADTESRLSLAQNMTAFSKFHAHFSSAAQELASKQNSNFGEQFHDTLFKDATDLHQRFEELSKKDTTEYNTVLATYLSQKNMAQEHKERKLLLDAIDGYSRFFSSMVEELEQLKQAVAANDASSSSRKASISDQDDSPVSSEDSANFLAKYANRQDKLKKRYRMSWRIMKASPTSSRKELPLPPSSPGGFPAPGKVQTVKPQPGSPSPEPSPRELDAKLVLDKVVTSEKDYAFNLISVTQVYLHPMRKLVATGGMTEEDLEIIFSNITVIYNRHTRALRVVEQALRNWNESSQAGKIFLDLVTELGLELYLEYADNFPYAMDRLQQRLKKSKQLREFLKNTEKNIIEKHAERDDTLTNQLESPLIHIDTYLEYARRLKHCAEDMENLKQAQMILLKAKDTILAHSKVPPPTLVDLIEFRDRLTGYDGDIVRPGRRFKTDREFTLVNPQLKKPEKHTLWLANDILLIVKSTGKKFKFVHEFKPEQLQIRMLPNSAELKNAFQLYCLNTNDFTYTYSANTEADRQLWVDQIVFFCGRYRVFGQPLARLMANEIKRRHDPDRKVPELVTTICEHMLTFKNGKLLKTMGVFRESGKKTAQIELEEAMERGDILNLQTQRHGNDPHVLAGVLKLWLRQLPQPVCTFDLYDEFLNAVKKERNDSVIPLKQAIAKLPEYNYALLEYMVRFLVEVVKHEEINKMGTNNCGIIFGPTFLDNGTASLSIPDPRVFKLIEFLILSYEEVFDKPLSSSPSSSTSSTSTTTSTDTSSSTDSPSKKKKKPKKDKKRSESKPTLII